MTQVIFKRLAAKRPFLPIHPGLSIAFSFCEGNSHRCPKLTGHVCFYIKDHIPFISPSAKTVTRTARGSAGPASSILSALAGPSIKRKAHSDTLGGRQLITGSPHTALARSFKLPCEGQGEIRDENPRPFLPSQSPCKDARDTAGHVGSRGTEFTHFTQGQPSLLSSPNMFFL